MGMRSETMAKREKLKGNERAAILIDLLPIELKTEVMKRLDKDEKLAVAKVMKNKMSFKNDDIQQVMLNYITYMKGSEFGSAGGQDYIYSLFKDSMSEDELKDFMNRLFNDMKVPFEDIKKRADIKPLITILQKEDPQTIAIVASYLKPIQASQLIQSLPPEKMKRVALAIAQLDQPNQDVLFEIEHEINKMLDLFVSDEKEQTDGVKALVDIINTVPRSTEKIIFSYLDEVDRPLSEEVRDRLFMFEDIAKLEPRDVETIVNEVREDIVVAKALRGAPEEIKVLINNALAEGRRLRIADADSVLGKLRLQEVEEAQQEFSNVAKNLEKDGKIQILRGDDDVVL